MSQMSSPDTAPPKKSSNFWIYDGSIHFQVETVVYKVHGSNFQRLSPVVASILDIPDNTIGPKQGSEENPILLEFFTVEVFEDFLKWIYRTDWQPLDDLDLAVKERMLVNLLRVGSLWEITEAVQYAKHNLQLMHLPASRKLELARMYSLYDTDWIDKPVRKLLTGRLEWISELDVQRLGMKVYSVIAHAKETMWYELQLTACIPPKLDENPAWVSDEHDHRMCTEVFNEVWWGRIAKKIIDPVNPWALREVADKVRSTPFQVQRVGGWKTMADACKEDVAARIGTEGFFSENAIIDAAARAVERHFRSL
ncbi:hypothetical protein K438DRAFT_2007556 [Mycena galopus ATCC 62051]|nr:hypothetical protein K438DRAFT_2007556 [Mycena galopus ATCC 62051]